jgi:hypothetical protein
MPWDTRRSGCRLRHGSPRPPFHLGRQRLDNRPQIIIDFPRLRPSHPRPRVNSHQAIQPR